MFLYLPSGNLRPKKNNVVFPLTRPTLFYCPDPTDFIGKLVDKELKGQYKTNTTECGLQICWPLNNFDKALWKREKNEHFNHCFHGITYKFF